MGLKLGLDQIAEYARRCGFGRRLNVDLPDESNGLVPSRDYFNRRYGIRGWTKSLVLNLSIGQGEFLATPLQLASFFAALGNDGIMFTPHLVKQVQSKQGRVLLYKESLERRLPFSGSTLQILKNAAVAAVNDSNSTGTPARVPGVIVAGKTGSAENPHGMEHSWFVCYAPAENPQIAIAIIVENAGHGSEIAAPIAGKLISAYLKKDKQLVSSNQNLD
jgi:penicillin-binding protein 2